MRFPVGVGRGSSLAEAGVGIESATIVGLYGFSRWNRTTAQYATTAVAKVASEPEPRW
jgi:hypothetical protein